MSEEKVLTLRGKRAVWAPAPAGVGGGVQFVVNVSADESGELSADKEYSAVKSALDAGEDIVLKYYETESQFSYLRPTLVTSSGITFGCFFTIADDVAANCQISFYASGALSLTYSAFTPTPIEG